MGLQHPLFSATVLTLLLSIVITSSQAQSTAFTYQGRLTDSGASANGNYDLRFALFDNLTNGTQIGSTQTISAVSVTAGVFTVQLDFGPGAFPGANRWLEIGARLTSTPTFTTLSPRQPITSTPYAVRSLNASSADTVTVNGSSLLSLGPNTGVNNFLVGVNAGGNDPFMYVTLNPYRAFSSPKRKILKSACRQARFPSPMRVILGVAPAAAASVKTSF